MNATPLSDAFDRARSLGLAGQQAAVFAVLAPGGWVTTAAILDAVFGGRRDRAAANLVRVLVTKIRHRIRPAGLAIESVRRVGYRLVRADEAMPEAERIQMERDAHRGFHVPLEREEEYRFLRWTKHLTAAEARHAMRLP